MSAESVSANQNLREPSIWSFFPYSTVTIIAIIAALKYDIIIEMVEMQSSYFQVTPVIFVFAFIAVVALLMVVMKLLTTAFLYIQAYIKRRNDNILALAREKDALLAIYDCLDGPKWTNSANWCSKEPLSKWKGVYVHPTSHRVIRLILADNNLGGYIPEEIGMLPCLRELDLRFNRITGTSTSIIIIASVDVKAYFLCNLLSYFDVLH